MVVSTNNLSSIQEFEILLNKTINQLNKDALIDPNQISKLNGTKLEDYTCDIMTSFAIGTPFEGTITLVSGQKFPDIVANKYFGVEVKTTTQDHWYTTGNSVLESTRVEDVERIYMLFGKLGGHIEFRSRLYQHCLNKVVVTHSPRYLIDMNLPEGETIFDKMGLDYDTLRKLDQPIDPVVKYYRSLLQPGQDLWWINGENEEIQSSDFVIEMWSNKSSAEKHDIRLKSMTYFPEIFGSGQDKYNRLGIWLVKEMSTVCANLRDAFTAGGQETRIIDGVTYRLLPQNIVKLIDNYLSIVTLINESPDSKLKDFWGVTDFTNNNKVEVWQNQIIYYYSGDKSGIKSILAGLKKLR